MVMSETTTPHEPPVTGPNVAAAEYGQHLDAYGPEYSETPTPVNEPVEVEPVSWDGPHDPKNPKNWSASRKRLITFVNGIITVNMYVLRVVFSAVTS